MPAQILSSVENNFTKGLITESTGLNFPENAATSTDNCEYTLIGDVLRRQGIDFEENFQAFGINRNNAAISSYKWNNAGGDGSTQLIVVQVGSKVFFYNSTEATPASPTSTKILNAVIDLSLFAVLGTVLDPGVENTYADGNGYLFIFNEGCEPFYCAYANNTIAGYTINLQIRDFDGILDNLPINTRPNTMSAEHQYNLQNQGWTSGNPWSASSSTALSSVFGSNTWNIGGGIVGITIGQIVSFHGTSTAFPFNGPYVNGVGTVTSYSGGLLTLNVYTQSGDAPGPGFVFNNWTFTPTSTGYINTFFAAEGVYPSNADVWWYFKDTAGVFNPAVTQPNVTLSVGNAPRGHYLLNAFNLDRSTASGINGINSIATKKRPSGGAWFQGRVWYTGLGDSQQAIGDVPFYTWSENIYFSQVSISRPDNFGFCYQVNDPTSEQLFDLLPTDGGVIQIQGSGKIYKLFPIQNGMLVFAANGVWFITGSQGIGFSANDYTITKLSAVEALSPYSFVDVQGLPYFWNQEGIYSVQPQQGGGLTVEPLTVGTILTFYNDIPITSRKYVRGAYDKINYVIQWVYKTTVETSVLDRYNFDGILNYNTYNKAFYPYTIDNSNGSIVGIFYLQSPGDVTSVEPMIKYVTSSPIGDGTSFITFGDEHDSTYTDWASTSTPTDYTSFFVTGYKLRGQAIRKFQVQYVNMFSRMNDAENAYKFQTLWDFSNTRNSNRWSSIQQIFNTDTRYDTMPRRHKVRGRGYAVQLKVSSVSGQPFDIQGWAIVDVAEQGT